MSASTKLRLPYQHACHWQAILDFLSLRLFAGVATVHEGCYHRHGTDWQVTGSHQPGALTVETVGPAPTDTAARLHHLFDLAANTSEIEAHLRQSIALRPRVDANPGLRLPGCWDSFELVIRALAQAVLDVSVDLHNAASLEAVKGIGPWTAQYVLMRALHSPDAFPASDLVLMKNTGYTTPRALAQEAENWRPYRSYAAMHIWKFDDRSQAM